MGKGAEASTAPSLRTVGQNGTPEHSLPEDKAKPETPMETPSGRSGAEVKEKSPEQAAGFLSKIFFSWMDSLVKRGYKRPLEQDDLPPLMDKDDVKQVSTRFAKQWTKEVASTPSPSLTRTLFKVFTNRLLAGAVLALIANILMLLPSILLNTILIFIEGKPSNNFMYQIFGKHYGYYSAIAMLLILILRTLFETQHQQVMFRLEIHVKTALVETVYSKSLRLSNGARQTKSVGEIVTLMQVDTDKVATTTPFFHATWTGLIQIIGGTGLLVYYIGWSALVGVAMLFVTIPLQGSVVSHMMKLQRRVLINTSKRVKVVNEVLQGMRVVKSYAWETPFKKDVTEIRALEIAAMRQRVFLRALQMSIMLATPVLIMVVTFTVYTQVAKRELTAATVFTAMSLFNSLRGPLIFYPMVINMVLAGWVSLKRLSKFMNLSELTPVNRLAAEGQSPPLQIQGASFEWTAAPPEQHEESVSIPSCLPKVGKQKRVRSKQELPAAKAAHSSVNGALKSMNGTAVNGVVMNGKKSPVKKGTVDQSDKPPFSLKNLSVTVQWGELVAVVGPVGSGKSSLGSALLGEMDQTGGDRVTIRGSVAFCTQQAWIMNASLRDNILFGREFDEEQYSAVISACALTQDLEALPDGDRTEIGERGINLSGGQKQRVALARAVYADADVYILDDPLSAVDAHVGLHLFENCITGFLSQKTRIFITNQLQFVPGADHIVVLKDGVVVEQGGYQELMARGDEFARLMKDSGSHDEEGGTKRSGSTTKLATSASIKDLAAAATAKAQSGESQGKGGPKAKAFSKEGRLVEQEGRARGTLKFEVYKRYWTQSSYVWPWIMLGLFCVVQAVDAYNRYWLAYWTKDQFNQSTAFYLGVYSGLAMVYAALLYVRTVIHYMLALRTATKLHMNMLQAILQAPMAFFDTTPVGRVLNRFSADQSTVDDVLVMSWNMCLTMFFSLLSTVIVISIVTPWFLAALVPVSVVYLIIQQWYRRTARELKRLDSVTKSPVYQQFTETLNGLTTIRAYQHEGRFLRMCDGKLDANNRAFFYLSCCNRWLTVRLELLGAFLVFMSALLAVVSRDSLYAGYAGISIDYALQISFALSMLIRNITDTENQMNSVERMYEYTDQIDQEAPSIIEEHRPPTDWPLTGIIDIKELQMRYRPGLPLVLKGVSLTVKGGEKVGVVGRTGSGKSSLMLCLFRLIEPAGGSITIDSINIAQLGLEDLRSRMGIIPQDPVLFSGTIRSNLDPFLANKDEEVWQALDRAGLKLKVSAMTGKLESDVVEYGENFSVGERQLLCLARVLLRQSRILVMDEATSSVDFETDRLIQKTIRTDFKDTTMLIIAHRLNTIIDASRVLVMDDGHVAEFDKPAALLLSGGHFADLVQDTGPQTAEHLGRIARGEIDFFSSYDERCVESSNLKDAGPTVVYRTAADYYRTSRHGSDSDEDDSAHQRKPTLVGMKGAEESIGYDSVQAIMANNEGLAGMIAEGSKLSKQDKQVDG